MKKSGASTHTQITKNDVIRESFGVGVATLVITREGTERRELEQRYLRYLIRFSTKYLENSRFLDFLRYLFRFSYNHSSSVSGYYVHSIFISLPWRQIFSFTNGGKVYYYNLRSATWTNKLLFVYFFIQTIVPIKHIDIGLSFAT